MSKAHPKPGHDPGRMRICPQRSQSKDKVATQRKVGAVRGRLYLLSFFSFLMEGFQGP